MAYLPTNSTNTLLLANQEFIGEAVAVDKEYISVTCSFNSNVGGILEFFHSIDGFAFSNYADIYDFTDKPGSHSIEVSVKGKYFKIRYINGNQNQGVFNLFCKLNVTVGEAILNATYDTITVYAGGESGLNIRELTTDDKVSVPRLEQVLTSDSGVSALQCKITSMPAIVIPPITIGDVNIRDSNGNDILSTTAGFLKTEIMNSSLTVNTISGYATSANQVTAQASLTSLVTGTRIQASNGNLITCDASNNLNVKELNSASILSGITGIQNQLTTIHDDIVGLTHINTNTIIDNVVSVTGDFYPSIQSITGHVVVDNVLSVTGDFYPSIQSITGHVIVDNVLSVTGHVVISNPSLNVSLDCDTIVLTETADIAGKTALVTASSIYAYSADGGAIVKNITFSNPSYLNNEGAKNRLDVSTVLVDATNDLKIQIAPIDSVLLNGTNGLICNSVLMGTKENNDSSRLLMTDDSILKVHTGLTSLFISNEIIAVTGNFYPSVQSITGHVTIDNLVSVTGDFYPSIQSITGHVIVDNVLSVTGDFYPSIQSITGHVVVDNIVSVTGNVGITGTPDVHITNTSLDVVVDAASSSILIYGAYNGTGTGIQTNSSGNLDIVGSVDANCSGTIESKTLSGDGLAITATGVSSHVGLDVYVINNSLKIEPGATFASSNTFKNSVYDSTGTAITSSIPITGKNSLDTSSILYGKSGPSSLAPITTTVNGTRQEVDVSLAQAVDVHLYAKKPINGGAQEVLNSDNHNHLAVRLTNDDESKYNTFDSSDSGLNVHVTNTSLPISITDVTSKIEDSSGNAITSLTTPSNCVGALKTALYGTVTNNAIGDTAASPHGTTKTGLNNFIVNSYTLPVICGGYDGTNTQAFKTTTGGSQIVAFDTANNMVGITSAFNTIKIDTSNNTIKIDNANNTVQFSQTLNQNNIKITDSGGNIATIRTPDLPSGVSSIRGLDTQACVNALDVYNNTYANVTLTPAASGPTAGYKALDVYAHNPSTTVNKSLFGANNTGTYSGINMYPIQPKVKQLVMSGTTSTANGILGGHNSLQTISNVNWGITQPKTFYITMNSGGTAKTFYYDYVDTNGNERTMNYTIPTPITAWYALPLQTGFTEQMVGINNVRVSTSLTTADTYFISNTQNTGNTVCSGSYGRTYNAVITIPNNAIGYVTNVYMFNAVASNYDIWKYDNQTGARKMIYYYNTAFATNHMSAGADGSLGGYLQAGEAVLGGNENANNMVVFANVVIKYLS